MRIHPSDNAGEGQFVGFQTNTRELGICVYLAAWSLELHPEARQVSQGTVPTYRGWPGEHRRLIAPVWKPRLTGNLGKQFAAFKTFEPLAPDASREQCVYEVLVEILSAKSQTLLLSTSGHLWKSAQ